MAAAWGSGATQEAGEPSDSSRASGQGKTPLDSWGVGQQRPPRGHEQSGVLPYSLWVTSYLGCPRTLKMPFFKKLKESIEVVIAGTSLRHSLCLHH